jgi:L,D-transpeptidase ErfK/SrfK
VKRVSTYKIVVSLSQRRLFLYENQHVRKSYPVGIGKILSQTPVGDFLIVNKQAHPGSPYGVMWMGLSKRHYGIHGTNNPASIGKRVSKGCIRMYNHDVLELASLVPLGTHVYLRS